MAVAQLRGAKTWIIKDSFDRKLNLDFISSADREIFEGAIIDVAQALSYYSYAIFEGVYSYNDACLNKSKEVKTRIRAL